MHRKLYFFLSLIVLFIFIHSVATAQSKFTISGSVRDKQTGELLIGASIKIQEVTGGTITISYGFFSITLLKGKYTLIVSHSGFLQSQQTIELAGNTQINVDLLLSGVLDEIHVSSKKKNDNILRPIMGVEKLNMKDINQIPVLFGENDILKSIQLLPGIKSDGEASSGFYVRGGAADQNLILLDEAPVYNASHLLGFFSTFNSDAIKDVSIYKGSMLAQYGGRLSSVLDIKMKEGNNKEFDINGGIGLISSRINIEGPIVKEKGSFILSARRSYADAFLKLSNDTQVNKNSLYFYDFNIKANYSLGKNDRLYLSGYFGRDMLGVKETFNTNWGNATGTLRWNHIANRKLFSNTSLIFSDYNYNISIKPGADKFVITSQIKDVNLKQDFDYYVTSNSKIKFGANIIRHIVSPGRVDAESNSLTISKVIQNKYSWESALYASNEWGVSKKINILYGARLSNLMVTGPGNYYSYDDYGNPRDTTHYPKGKKVVSYINFEPRINVSFLLNSNNSLKAFYNRNVQNLHLLSTSITSGPTDLWLPGSNNIKPEISDQFAVGYFQNFKENSFEWSIESYYKFMQNQIDYRNGANLDANDHIESELLYGVGRSYGVELLLKKKVGRLTGWIGYTLSKTERKINGINNNNYYNARQDRTHDLSIVGIYKYKPRLTLSGVFVYSTGNAVTFPRGKYFLNGQTIFLYTERNSYRMPAYHRLDLSATLEEKLHKKHKFHSSWTFGLYNAYGHQNPFSIEFKNDPKDPANTIAERTTLFSFVPSVTWNFKF